MPQYGTPEYWSYMNTLGSIEDDIRRGKERMKQNGGKCKYHLYRFRNGSTVELGSDAGYFCVYCGQEKS